MDMEKQKIASYKYECLFIIFSSLVLLAYLRWPLWTDHCQYLVMGKYWLEGLLPYRDVFDQNWPGTIWISQAILLLFGTSPLAVRVFDVFWQGATGAILYLVACRYLKKNWAIGTVTLYFSLYLASSFGSTATRDSFAALPLGLALWGTFDLDEPQLLLRGMMSGLMLGFGILIKPTLGLTAIFVGAGLLALAWMRREWRPTMLLAGLGFGLFVGLGLYGLYLIKTATLSAFLDAAVSYPRMHYARENPTWIAWKALKFLIFYPPGRLIILSIIGFWLILREKMRITWREWALILFAAGTLGSLLIQRKLSYVHSVPFCFFGSLLLLVGIARGREYIGSFLKRVKLVPKSDVCWIALTCLLVLPIGFDLPKSLLSVFKLESAQAYGDAARLSRGIAPWSLVQEVGEVIRSHSSKNEKILILSGPFSPDFYLVSGLKPAQKYIQPSHLLYDPSRTSDALSLALRNGFSYFLIDYSFMRDINQIELKRILQIPKDSGEIIFYSTHYIPGDKHNQKCIILYHINKNLL